MSVVLGRSSPRTGDWTWDAYGVTTGGGFRPETGVKDVPGTRRIKEESSIET